MNQDELDFLKESNAIEDVFDDDSLQQAIYAWEFLKTVPELTIGAVLKTHKILMLHQKLYPNEKGYFRNCDVMVGGQIKLSVDQIRPEMEKWIEEVKTDILGMRRLWKKRHVEYENIHPFIDGNGRTGRMFMNWQRLQLGLPILIVKASERAEYYQWFRE